MGRCFVTRQEWLTTAGFHLTAEELHAMGYPAPWPLLDPWQALVFAGTIVAAAIALFVNCWRRLVLVVLFLCALYAQRVDFMAAFTLNKLFVGVFAILALAPGIRTDPESGVARQSVTPVRVLQATLILQYFAAGIAKLNGDWLSGHDLLWTHVQGIYRTDAAAWALRSLPQWAWAVQQHLALVFEACAPLWFLVRQLRPVAFVLGIGFHLIIALMMKDLIFFSAQMLCFYVLFVNSNVLECLLRYRGAKLGNDMTPD